jgi:hypothetical protein
MTPCALLTWNSETVDSSDVTNLRTLLRCVHIFQIQNVFRCEGAEVHHIVITEHTKIFTLRSVAIYKISCSVLAE